MSDGADAQISSSPLQLALSRCARPTLGTRRRSTYTVLGFVGYGVANALAVVLALRWQLTLTERLIAVLLPPAAFVLTSAAASAIKGREWLVLYHALFAALTSVTLVGFLVGADLRRVLDLSTLGIGAFLVFGRLGCFHVGCCHGRPLRTERRSLQRLGVAYGPAQIGRLEGFANTASGIELSLSMKELTPNHFECPRARIDEVIAAHKKSGATIEAPGAPDPTTGARTWPITPKDGAGKVFITEQMPDWVITSGGKRVVAALGKAGLTEGAIYGLSAHQGESLVAADNALAHHDVEGATQALDRSGLDPAVRIKVESALHDGHVLEPASDGTLYTGAGPKSDIVIYSRKAKPKNWGEAALFRSANQGKSLEPERYPATGGKFPLGGTKNTPIIKSRNIDASE